MSTEPPRSDETTPGASSVEHPRWMQTEYIMGEADKLAARFEDFEPETAMTVARWMHYVSTYCIHEDHSACRLTCKTCNRPCRCACHQRPVAKP